MAIYQDDYETEEEEAPVAGGAPVATVAGGPSAANGASGQGPAETAGFVNFDRYFNTNAATAQGMADNVAQDVQARGDKATKAVDDSYAQFQENVKNAGQAYDGPLYFGDRQDLSGTYDAVNDATTAYGALGSFGGRQALLEDQNANTISNYSKGMSRFDTALLGRAGGDQFQGMQDNFAGFDGWFQDATNRGQTEIDQARTDRAPVAPPPVAPPSRELTPEQQEEIRKDRIQIKIGRGEDTNPTMGGYGTNQSTGRKGTSGRGARRHNDPNRAG